MSRETVLQYRSARASGQVWAVAALCCLVSACQRENASHTAAVVQAGPEASQPSRPPVTLLPLQRGYYVASDTPCRKASNATLLLLRRHGIGGARDFCEFKNIQQIGPETYRVEEVCADFQGSDPERRTLQYQIKSNTRFVISDQNGIVLDARYCAQTDLPPDWRNTDIRSEIE
ncbi:MAG: hypothetical protein IT489_02980 [Gammaproteobacteria bacterium]|nr:hypothetical protein [Gammaproteobacteria bacterium]